MTRYMTSEMSKSIYHLGASDHGSKLVGPQAPQKRPKVPKAPTPKGKQSEKDMFGHCCALAMAKKDYRFLLFNLSVRLKALNSERSLGSRSRSGGH